MALTERKNQQIIQAAIAEFQERGFLGASMDRISERAQVSKRTVYNHFESKDALFRAINNCMMGQITETLNITFDPNATIRDELTRLGWKQGEIVTDPCAMGIARMIMGEVIRDPQLCADMSQRMNMVRIVEKFMSDAAAAGKLDIDDPWVAAEQFLGLIKARAFFPKIFGEELATREEMQAIIEQSVDMFLKSYAPNAVHLATPTVTAAE